MSKSKRDDRYLEQVEKLLDMSSWFVIDIFPEQIRKENADQYFKVEKYYLKTKEVKRICHKFINIILKLNCYYDFYICFHKKWRKNPKPDKVAKWIKKCMLDKKGSINILLDNEKTLLTIDRDDLCFSIYHPSEEFKSIVLQLAKSEGLYLREVRE
ncbi:MAG: hypothetical protein Q4D45_08945 [Lachnospiraceae bacterium]|nr:hypothetical protein [Lachnospiraceae bacterium]